MIGHVTFKRAFEHPTISSGSVFHTLILAASIVSLGCLASKWICIDFSLGCGENGPLSPQFQKDTQFQKNNYEPVSDQNKTDRDELLGSPHSKILLLLLTLSLMTLSLPRI